MKPWCCNKCSVWFSFASLKGPFLKKKKKRWIIWMRAQIHPHAARDARLRTECWKQAGSSLSFSRGQNAQDFQTFTFRSDIWPQNTSALCLSPFWISYDLEKTAVILDHVRMWPLLCMIRALTFVDGTMNCDHRQWFLEGFLSRCSDFHEE